MHNIQKSVLLILFFLLSKASFPQALLELRIIDAQTSEKLIGASVINLENNVGETTDYDGTISIDAPHGGYQFGISYLGYQTDTLSIDIHSDTTIVYKLEDIASELTTTEVIGTETLRDAGVVSISKQFIEKIPTVFGEREVVRAIQLLPGVQSGSEGSTDIFVRGGSSDHNLITLDGVPLYNINHLFGMMSVFNSDVVESADLYKNYVPPSFHGRLSSAVKVNTASPSLYEKSFGFQIGLLASKVYYSTPIVKDKLSIHTAFRGSYMGLFIKPITKSQMKSDKESGYISYYFYDLNTALNYRINQKHRIETKFFHSNDIYKTESNNDRVATVLDVYSKEMSDRTRWNNYNFLTRHIINISDDLIIQQSLLLSKSSTKVKQEIDRKFSIYKKEEVDLNKNEKIKRLSSILNSEYSLRINWIRQHHVLKTGISFSNLSFKPNLLDMEYEDSYGFQEKTVHNKEKQKSQEHFLDIEYVLNQQNVILNIGSQFFYYKYLNYLKLGVTPKASIDFILPRDFNIQVASSLTNQNIHLVTGDVGNVLSNHWIPSTKKAPAQSAYQGSISFGQKQNSFQWSLDAYYRLLKNQLEFIVSDNTQYITRFDEFPLSGGKGRAYGLETYLTMTLGKFDFSLTYNLSKSERKFKKLNQGKWYPYTFDRRHDISSIITYKINEKLSLSAMWVYGSGRPYTLYDLEYAGIDVLDFYAGESHHESITDYQYAFLNYTEERNSRNLKPYHHLDFSLDYKWRKHKLKHALNFSIYNIYNRKNVFTLQSVARGEGLERQRQFQSISLQPLMPSISYAIHL